MKIILTQRVSNVGQIGEVVEVKNGYARNFLIPANKAIAFNENSQKIFESKKAEFEKQNQDKLSQANKAKDKLVGKDLIIVESASDDGRLYGSVNSAVIANKVNEILGSKAVARTEIFLKKPIKEIGVYEVGVELHSDAVVELRLIVTRSESEIEALLKADAKAKKGEDSAEKSEKKSKKEVAEGEVAVEEVSEKSSEEKPKKAKKKKAE